MEITDEQMRAIEADYEAFQRERTAALGFREISLIEELRKDLRERGITEDDRGRPI